MLNLWINGYTLALKLIGENPPIGGYPEVTTSPEGTSFTVYGGGPFTIEIGDLKSLENSTQHVPNITEWKISGLTGKDEDHLLVGETVDEKLQISNKRITGRMVGAAKPGASVTFKLEAISNGQTVSIFPITLQFAEIFKQKDSAQP